MAIRLVIIEDDKSVLATISSMLSLSEDLEIVKTFHQAEPFLVEADTLAPDVVLMDIGLPRMSGIECLAIAKPRMPKVQFLMWTNFEDDEKIFNALHAGANGYVLKSAPVPEIIEAITDIHRGGSPMSKSIARKVIQSFHAATVKTAEHNLSKRETEVLDLLAKGYRYKEISEKLFISTETVRTHIHRIYDKLQVQSRAEAVNKVYPKR